MTLNSKVMRPGRTGIGAPLGELEQAVMRCVWDKGAAGVAASDAHRELEQQRPIALTTVLTTLDRLRAKGIVRREREGKAYRYWALVEEDELKRRIVEGAMERLVALFPHAVASYFAQVASPRAGDVQSNAVVARLAEQVRAMVAESEENRDA